MRRAKSSHLEWGYLAPPPNFFRTARIVLVATAVGATAGAGVVISLVDRTAGQRSVAAGTLVRPIPAGPTPDSAPQADQASGTNAQAESADASEWSTDRSTHASNVAGLVEVPAVTVAMQKGYPVPKMHSEHMPHPTIRSTIV